MSRDITEATPATGAGGVLGDETTVRAIEHAIDPAYLRYVVAELSAIVKALKVESVGEVADPGALDLRRSPDPERRTKEGVTEAVTKSDRPARSRRRDGGRPLSPGLRGTPRRPVPGPGEAGRPCPAASARAHS